MGLDNLFVARVLGEVADLLELKGENPFKIRAYRSAADSVATHPEPVAALDETELRSWPGIGKDLAARIRDIAVTGTCGIHQDLQAQFPPTILDLLRLQGVGPKTVATLYAELRIASLDDLERAAKAGALRALKGMGARKEQLLLKALEERKQHANRHLLADATEHADELIAFLQRTIDGYSFDAVGSLRRGAETCGDVDILATPAGAVDAQAPAPPDPGQVMAAFTSHSLVERVLGHGQTKASVLTRGGLQVDLRVVARESRGAALQYFTGSKAHNIALRDRALSRDMLLNEYGLFRTEDQTRLAGDTEEGIYAALGLSWIPPELRENRGEIDAAAEGPLPDLVTWADLRGDLHMHTTESDGKEDLESMVLAARAAGLQYVAITDHSQSLAMANGLDEKRALAHAARIRALDARIEGIRVLAGIECDILPDGSMDLASDCLAQLDIVIASVHSALRQDASEMTARLLRAIEHPWVDIIGHPTGRRVLKREPSQVHMDQVVAAAAAAGVALEINGQAERMDLSDINARMARERGIKLVVSSDAHSSAALSLKRWALAMARRAGATRADVLNTLPFEQLRASLRRHRDRPSHGAGRRPKSKT
jgi:DNA polymerase (family 10)